MARPKSVAKLLMPKKLKKKAIQCQKCESLAFHEDHFYDDTATKCTVRRCLICGNDLDRPNQKRVINMECDFRGCLSDAKKEVNGKFYCNRVHTKKGSKATAAQNNWVSGLGGDKELRWVDHDIKKEAEGRGGDMIDINCKECNVKIYIEEIIKDRATLFCSPKCESRFFHAKSKRDRILELKKQKGTPTEKEKKTKSEAKIQAECLEWLNALPNAMFFKKDVGAFSQAGILDLVGHINGHYFEIEVKRKGEKVEAGSLQSKRIYDLNRSNAHGLWVDSLDDLKKEMDRNTIEGAEIKCACGDIHKFASAQGRSLFEHGSCIDCDGMKLNDGGRCE